MTSPTANVPEPVTRRYRYYEFVMVAFVTILICSNLIGPAKIAQIDAPLLGTLTFWTGVLFFPVSYVFGDILTEVYGYARSRRVIWAGFAGLSFASLMAYVVVALPPHHRLTHFCRGRGLVAFLPIGFLWQWHHCR